MKSWKTDAVRWFVSATRSPAVTPPGPPPPTAPLRSTVCVTGAFAASGGAPVRLVKVA